jgi:hypothetical protein
MSEPWEDFQAPAPQAQVPTQATRNEPWHDFQPSTASSLGDVPNPNANYDPMHQKQMQVESGGNQAAVSPRGAVGVMQVMPATGPEAAALAGLPWDPVRFKNDASYNEALGAAYQKHQEDTFGDKRLGYAAYNAGPGRVSETIQKYGDPSKGELSWDQFASHLPEETRDYVNKIAGNSTDTRDQIVRGVQEYGRVAQSAIKQGLAVPANLAADIYRGGEQVARAPFDLLAHVAGTTLDDTLGHVSDYLPNHTPGEYAQEFAKWLTALRPYDVPETEAGKVAAGISGAGLAAMATPLPGAGVLEGAATRGIYGGLSNVGSQVGEQATGGSPVGAVIGGLAVPSVAQGIETLLPTAVKSSLAKAATSGLSPEDMLRARQIQTQARDVHGVDLTLGQSLPTGNNVLGAEQILSQKPGGQGLLNQLREQPGQIVDTTQNFQKSVPGQVLNPRQAANTAQEEATNTINQAAQYRQSQVGPLIEGAGDIPTPMAQGIIGDLKRLAASNPGTTKGQLIQSLVDKLQVIKPLYRDGVQIGEKQIPLTNINQINEVLKSESNAGKNLFNAGSSDKSALGLQTAIITRIKNQLGDVNPTFKKGNELNAYIHETLDNPIKQGPIGQIAGQSGYLEAKSAPEKIFSIFDKGTPLDPKTGKALPSDILQTQRMFSSNGPEGAQAFTDIGASWIARNFNKAITNNSGQPNADVASSIEQQFFGTDAKRQGFKDVLAGIARSSGQDEKSMVDGGMNLMKTIQRAASVKGVGPGVTDAQLQKAQETSVGFLGRFTAVQPFRQPALFLQRFLGGDAEGEISNMLRTPEGVSQLMKLAKVQPGSTAAMKIISEKVAPAATNVGTQIQPQNGGQ